MTTPPPFAWVLNQDAELELARPGYTPAARTTTQIAQHGSAARALLGEADFLITDAHVSARGFVGRAWCPTPSAVARLRAAGAQPEPHPPVHVLRRVNHRQFAHELGGGLPGQAYVKTRAELERHIAGAPASPWLLKRPLAFAGRGQMRLLGPITAAQEQWIDASFRSDGLIVEPRIVPLLEVSLHGFIWPDGRHQLGRACIQQISDRGVYRGIRLAEDNELTAEESAALFQQGERVATALFAAGHFGPFGIDAHRHQRGDTIGFCALSEINARYTMGFAVGFPTHPSALHL